VSTNRKVDLAVHEVGGNWKKHEMDHNLSIVFVTEGNKVKIQQPENIPKTHVAWENSKKNTLQCFAQHCCQSSFGSLLYRGSLSDSQIFIQRFDTASIFETPTACDSISISKPIKTADGTAYRKCQFGRY
jgi:hypothetical protein